VSDLADALLAGTRAAPTLDPSIVYGLAQTAGPGDLADHAAATEGFGQITKRLAWLKSEDKNRQASYWSAISDSERSMLTQAGYSPPAVEASHHRGLLGQAGHLLGNAADLLLAEPARQVSKDVTMVLHAAGAGGHFVQHVGRADWRLWDNATDDSGTMSGGKLLSPHQWAKAWRETEHGEQTFSPIEERKIEKRYEPDTVNLARQIAGGTDPNDIVLAAPEDQRPALAQRIQSDPDLQRAVTDFNAAKYSLGRQVLGPALQKKLTVTLPKSVPFMGGAEVNPVSGAIDAVFGWYTDPLVIGLSAAKGAELARYSIRGPADIDRLAANPNVDRAIKDVADTLNQGGAGALIERWPRLAPVAEQLVKEGVDSPEKLTEWFKGNAGMSALLTGRATGVSHAVPQMLKLNLREAAFLDLKGGLKKAIDWMADTPFGIATKTGDEAQAGAIRGFVGRRTQGFGRMAREATTLTQRGLTFDPSSPDAITTIQRLGLQVLPAERVRDIVNVWSAAPDLATKRDIYKGLLGEMFDAAGVTASEEGRRWAAGFTSAIDDAVTKPIYSASGADTVLRDGVEARRGLLEPQLTHEWAMPPFRELWAQSKRANTLGRVYQGTVNADGISKFMESVWKPTTLLRLGFPIRAGGEELVAAIMREGPMGLIRGRAAAGATKGEMLGQADRLLPRIIRWLRSGTGCPAICPTSS
jgi:hypothetical protein